MTRLRFWVVVSLIWFAILFSVGRYCDALHIASSVCALAAAVAVLTVTFAPLQRLDTFWLIFASLAVLPTAKLALGCAIAGPALPLTALEALVLATTVVFSRQIALSIGRCEGRVLPLPVPLPVPPRARRKARHGHGRGARNPSATARSESPRFQQKRRLGASWAGPTRRNG